MAKEKEKNSKPVSRKASKIVGEIAKGGIVEELVRNTAHRSKLDADLSDLVQLVYLILLQTDIKRLESLTASGEMRFYIAGIIRRQYFSKSSPYYRVFKHFGSITSEISPQISETYEAR